MFVKIRLMQILSVLNFWQKQMAVETDLFDCIDSYEHVFAYNGVLNFWPSRWRLNQIFLTVLIPMNMCSPIKRLTPGTVWIPTHVRSFLNRFEFRVIINRIMDSYACDILLDLCDIFLDL